MRCKSCLTQVHAGRWQLGYRTCLECSVEPKWSGVPVINHKTGNEIQIVKDPEVAAEFLAKSARVGFGTLRGVSSSYRARTNSTAVQAKVVKSKPLVDRIVEKRKLPHEFEKVGVEVMVKLESESADAALKYIDMARAEGRIYGNHASQLKEIVKVISGQTCTD